MAGGEEGQGSNQGERPSPASSPPKGAAGKLCHLPLSASHLRFLSPAPPRRPPRGDPACGKETPTPPQLVGLANRARGLLERCLHERCLHKHCLHEHYVHERCQQERCLHERCLHVSVCTSTACMSTACTSTV
jgi:hypothetical protein